MYSGCWEQSDSGRRSRLEVGGGKVTAGALRWPQACSDNVCYEALGQWWDMIGSPIGRPVSRGSGPAPAAGSSTVSHRRRIPLRLLRRGGEAPRARPRAARLGYPPPNSGDTRGPVGREELSGGRIGAGLSFGVFWVREWRRSVSGGVEERWD